MQREVKEKAKDQPQFAIVASVQLPGVSDVEFEASLTELRELAKTLGFTVTHAFMQKRNGFDKAAYVGIGKRQEIRRFVNTLPDDEAWQDDAMNKDAMNKDVPDSEAVAVSPVPIEALFIDHEISPSQARNLEKEVGCR
jgi:GTP-binding protein HflX